MFAVIGCSGFQQGDRVVIGDEHLEFLEFRRNPEISRRHPAIMPGGSSLFDISDA